LHQANCFSQYHGLKINSGKDTPNNLITKPG
jgi:hypothetical protein